MEGKPTIKTRWLNLAVRQSTKPSIKLENISHLLPANLRCCFQIKLFFGLDHVNFDHNSGGDIIKFLAVS